MARRVRDPRPRAVEAAHHGAERDVERRGRLGVAEAGEIDRRDDVAERVGELPDRRVHLIGARGLLGVGAHVGLVGELLVADEHRLALLRAAMVVQDVAQRARQVGELTGAA